MVINISSGLTLLFITTGSELLWELGIKACGLLRTTELYSYYTISGLSGQLVLSTPDEDSWALNETTEEQKRGMELQGKVVAEIYLLRYSQREDHRALFKLT